MARQINWRWCKKCQGLFYSGNPDQGACPSGGKHDASSSGYYDAVIGDNIAGAQNFWRWCYKCEGLFYSGNPDQGACPAGGKHDGSQSGHYSVVVGNAPATGLTQVGWRWCGKCQGLFYSGNPDQGACPSGGKHDGSASGPYGASFETNLLNQIVLASGPITFSGGVPVGGWANVSLFPDGSYNLTGSFHDSGFTDYNVSVLWVLRSSIGQAFTFAASGHVCGTDPFCTDPRDFPINNAGTNPAIVDAWADLSAYYSSHWSAQTSLDIGTLWNGAKSSIGTIESVVSVVGPILAL